MTDTLADLLTRIRNAQKARKDTVSIPYSRLKLEVAKKMQEKGFVAGVNVEKGESFDNIIVELDANRMYPVTLTRVSKSGQRIYRKASELRPVKSGLGIEILSTSQGVMTNEEAKAKNIGGEVLCSIY
jgi:small subunit ribosomal protein S8